MARATSPEVSIIVPTYARPDRLVRCVTALLQSEGVSIEIVVVDDGSPKPAVDVLDDAGLLTAAVRTHRQENAGPAAARNAGARIATAPILLFTDDDCEPAPGWAAIMAAKVAAAHDALVGGTTANALEANPFSGASQDLVSYLYEGGAVPDYFTSNNMACGKDAFIALGGFDESFPLAAGEDREFGLRWAASGRPLIYEPAAVVLHHHLLDLKGFWRQHANYGRGARHLRRLGRAGGQTSHRFSGPAFYAGLVGYPIKARRPQAVLRAGLLLLSQAATTWGFATPPRAKG